MLETHLLPARNTAEFTSSLSSPSELVARIRRSPVYGSSPALEKTDDPMRVASALEAAAVNYVRRLRESTPDPRVADYFLLPYDLPDLSNYLKSKYSEQPRRRPSLSSLPQESLDDFFFGVGLSGEPAKLVFKNIYDAASARAESGDVIPAEVIDLMADAAFIEAIPSIIAPLKTDVLDEFAAAKQRFMLIESATRARLSGMDAAIVKDLLLSKVAAGPEIYAIVEASDDSIRRAITAALPPEFGEFDTSRGAAALQKMANGFETQLEKILEPAKYVVFGPERVFFFLWSLFRENRNLRAVLGGQAGKISHELVGQSLRGING